jgi:hypothetical protein
MCTFTATDFSYLLSSVIALSGAHLFCLHKSLRAAVLPTLSIKRAELALNKAILESSEASVRYPYEVAELEPIFFEALNELSLRNGTSYSTRVAIDINPKLNEANCTLLNEWIARFWREDKAPYYALAVYWSDIRRRFQVDVLIAEEATWDESLHAVIHALCAKQLLVQGEHTAGSSIVPTVYEESQRHCNAISRRLIPELERRGWWVGQPYLTNQSPWHLTIQRLR